MIVFEKLSQNILDITNQSNMTDEEKDAIQTLLGMFLVHHNLTIIKLNTPSNDDEIIEQPKPKRKYTRRKKEQTNEKTENSYPVEQSLPGQAKSLDISV